MQEKYYTRTEASMLTGMASTLEPIWQKLVQLAEFPEKPTPGPVTVEMDGHPVRMLLNERGKVQTWKISGDSFENLRLIAGEYPVVPKGKQWLSMTDFAKPPSLLKLEKSKPIWNLLNHAAEPRISPVHYEATVQLGDRDVRVAMFKAPSPTLYVHKDSVENVLRFHAEQQAVPENTIEDAVHKGMQALSQKALKGRSGI